MKKFLGSLFIALSLATSLTPVMADTSPQNPALTVGQAQDEADSLNLDSRSLGLEGPLSISTQYSQDYGVSVDAKYVQGFFGNFEAAALEAQYGQGIQRYGLTFAQMITENQRIKATIERLTEKMQFDFASGDIKKQEGQNAYGLGYQYVTHQAILKSIDVNGYYSKADSHNLSTQTLSNGYLDYRRIAGGEDKNLSGGVELAPWSTGLLSVAGNYDDLHYDTKYESKDASRGLGYTVTLDQLITQKMKFNLLGSVRKPYRQFGGGLSYLLPTSARNFWELGASVQRDLGNHGLGDDTQYALNASFSWDSKPADYTIDNTASLSDLKSWANLPVVHEAQVLAIKDEKIVAPSLLNTPVKTTVSDPYSPNIITVPSGPDTPLGKLIAEINHPAGSNFTFVSQNAPTNPPDKSAIFQSTRGSIIVIDKMPVSVLKSTGPGQWGPPTGMNLTTNFYNVVTGVFTVGGSATTGVYQFTVRAHDQLTNTYAYPDQTFYLYIGGASPERTSQAHAGDTWQSGQNYSSDDLSAYFAYDVNHGGALQFPNDPQYVHVTTVSGDPVNSLSDLGLTLNGSHLVLSTATPPHLGQYNISLWSRNNIGPSVGRDDGALIIPLTIVAAPLHPPLRSAVAYDGPTVWHSGSTVSIDVSQNSQNQAYFTNPEPDQDGEIVFHPENVTVTTDQGDSANSLADLSLALNGDHGQLLESTGPTPGKIGTYTISIKAQNNVGVSADALVISLTTTLQVISPPLRSELPNPSPQTWAADMSHYSLDVLHDTNHAAYFTNPEGDTMDGPIHYTAESVTVTTNSGTAVQNLQDLNLSLDPNTGLLHNVTDAGGATTGNYTLSFRATNNSGQLSADAVKVVLSTQLPSGLPQRTSAVYDGQSTWHINQSVDIDATQDQAKQPYFSAGSYDLTNPKTVTVARLSAHGVDPKNLQDLHLRLTGDGHLVSLSDQPPPSGDYQIDLRASNSLGFALLPLSITLHSLQGNPPISSNLSFENPSPSWAFGQNYLLPMNRLLATAEGQAYYTDEDWEGPIHYDLNTWPNSARVTALKGQAASSLSDLGLQLTNQGLVSVSTTPTRVGEYQISLYAANTWGPSETPVTFKITISAPTVVCPAAASLENGVSFGNNQYGIQQQVGVYNFSQVAPYFSSDDEMRRSFGPTGSPDFQLREVQYASGQSVVSCQYQQNNQMIYRNVQLILPKGVTAAPAPNTNWKNTTFCLLTASSHGQDGGVCALMLQ